MLSDLSAAGAPVFHRFGLDGSLVYRDTFGATVGFDSNALYHHYPGN